MKIAFKTRTSLLGASSILGFLLMVGFVPSAHAADVDAAAPIAMPSPSTPAVGNVVFMPSAPAAVPAVSRAQSLSALEDKVSDSVKNATRQLGSIDNVNLDDLNTARQAIVKLEILIDIEKHLAELDKLRGEHGSERSLASAIPASALGAMPMPTMPRISPASMTEMPSMGMSHNEVTRISGAGGRYTALIQGKPFQVGDSLPDGSMVLAIGPKEVTTKAKDGVIHTLKVKGVSEIYGHNTL